MHPSEIQQVRFLCKEIHVSHFKLSLFKSLSNLNYNIYPIYNNYFIKIYTTILDWHSESWVSTGKNV